MNWTDFRTAVRSLLGDPTGGIYSDADINQAGQSAYMRVMTAHPLPSKFSVAVLEGDDSVGLPQAVVTIRTVHTGKWSVEPGTPADMGNPAHSSARLMFSLAGSQSLQLSRATTAAEAGVWTILATRIPALPATTANATAWESPAALDGAIIRHTAADLIRTRIATSTRRGHKPDYTQQQLANSFARDAEAISRNYDRTPRTT